MQHDVWLYISSILDWLLLALQQKHAFGQATKICTKPSSAMASKPQRLVTPPVSRKNVYHNFFLEIF